MPRVQAPDGTVIDFPDSMAEGDIEQAMGKLFPAPHQGTTAGVGKTGFRLKGNATKESPLLSTATGMMLGGPILGPSAGIVGGLLGAGKEMGESLSDLPFAQRLSEASHQGKLTAQATPTFSPRSLLYSLPGAEAVSHYLGLPHGVGAVADVAGYGLPKVGGYLKGFTGNLMQEPYGPMPGPLPEGWAPPPVPRFPENPSAAARPPVPKLMGSNTPTEPVTPFAPGKGTGTKYGGARTDVFGKPGKIIPRGQFTPPPEPPGPEMNIEGVGPVRPIQTGPVNVPGAVPQTVTPFKAEEAVQPVDRVEMNRILHAKVQRLNLPGSPAGTKSPGLLTDIAKSKFNMGYDRLSVDQLKQLYEHLDTLAK